MYHQRNSNNVGNVGDIVEWLQNTVNTYKFLVNYRETVLKSAQVTAKELPIATELGVEGF